MLPQAVRCPECRRKVAEALKGVALFVCPRCRTSFEIKRQESVDTYRIRV